MAKSSTSSCEIDERGASSCFLRTQKRRNIFAAWAVAWFGFLTASGRNVTCASRRLEPFTTQLKEEKRAIIIYRSAEKMAAVNAVVEDNNIEYPTDEARVVDEPPAIGKRFKNIFAEAEYNEAGIAFGNNCLTWRRRERKIQKPPQFYHFDAIASGGY